MTAPVSPRHRPLLRIYLAALSRYWSIVRFKTYANLKRDIDKTYLGTVWWVLEPLINTAVFYVIFTQVLHNRTPDFVLFLLVGNTIYGHFSSAINGGAGAIAANAGLMQQIQLPKSIYSIIAICNLTWKFLFSFVVILPLLWLMHSPPNVAYLALPALLALQLFAVLALSLPLSILIPYFPDGRTLLATVLSVGMWLSGVFFDSSRLQGPLLRLFYLNPAATLIDSYRRVLIHGQWPDWPRLAAPMGLCALSAALGFWLISRLSDKVTKIPL